MGAPGRRALEQRLQTIRSEHAIDACVINGENAADGIGITPRLADQLLGLGVDAITLGNEYEISEYSRDDLIYTKDMLLAEPMKRIPIADPGLYDTPIPAYKSSS